MNTSCSSKIGWYFSRDSFFKILVSSSAEQISKQEDSGVNRLTLSLLIFETFNFRSHSLSTNRGFKTSAVSPSSVMVPLLEPPLLLERGWEEVEDSESPGPAWILGVGEGDGVKVGDVLLEVEEFPDWGLFFRSIFYRREMLKKVQSFGTLDVIELFWCEMQRDVKFHDIFFQAFSSTDLFKYMKDLVS